MSIAVGLASSALLAYGTYRYRSWDLDDSLIVARYGRNIASGNGWVFNEGVRWNASTSMLNTVGGTILGILTGSMRVAGHLLSTSFLLVGIGSAISIFVRRRMIIPAILVPFGLASFPLLLQTTGLEPALLIGTLMLYVAIADAGKPRWVVAGIFALVRPEGIILVPITALREWFVSRKLSKKGPLVAIAVTLPWYLFSFFYFGSFLPSSMANKLSQTDSGLWGPGNIYWRGMQKFALSSFGPILLWSLVVLALLGFISCLRRDRIVLAEAGIFIVVQQLAYLVLNPPGAPWHFVSMLIFLGFYAAIGLQEIASHLFARNFQLGLVAVSLGFLVIAPWVPTKNVPTPHFISYYKRAAEIVNVQFPKAESAAILEVGTFAYKSPLSLEVVDLVGLTTENVEFFSGMNNDLFFDSPPDLVLLHWPEETAGKDISAFEPTWKQERAIFNDSRFREQYVLNCTQSFPGYPKNYSGLAVFVRRDFLSYVESLQPNSIPVCH